MRAVVVKAGSGGAKEDELGAIKESISFWKYLENISRKAKICGSGSVLFHSPDADSNSMGNVMNRIF